jgi:hypothetical protein
MELELQEQCANMCTIFWSTLSSEEEEFNSAKLWQCLSSAPFSDCLSNPFLMQLKNIFDWSASLRNYSPKTEAAKAGIQCSSHVQPMSSNLLFMLLPIMPMMLIMLIMPILVLLFFSSLLSIFTMLLPIITMLLVFLFLPVLLVLSVLSVLSVLLVHLLLPWLLPVLLPTQISQ